MNALRRLQPAALLWLACCATAPVSGPATPSPRPAASAWKRAAVPESLPAAPWKEPETRERVLPSGLRVVVLERHRRPLVSIRLVFPSGSATETVAEGGLTFISFALLGERFDRRTEAGELEVFDEKSARRQVAEAGGQLTFRVSADTSSIGIDGYSADTSAYLSMLDRVLRDRRHGEDSFANSRDGLLDALDDLELGDDQTFQQCVAQRAFGQGHVYARPVFGSTQSLSELGLEQVVERQNRLLRPAGTTLLVVGDVNSEVVFAKAAALFGFWTPRASLVPPKIPAPVVARRKSVMLVPRLPARTTMVCAARPLSDVKAPDAVLEVLAHIVGSNRLRDALRERRGLTYGTSAELVLRRHARAFLACSRWRGSETTEGLKTFLGTLAGLKASPPSEAEVERARAVIVSHLEATHDELSSAMASLTTALEVGRPPSAAGQIAAIRGVTTEEVQSLAAQLAVLDYYQLVMSGDPSQIEPAVRVAGLGATTTAPLAH
ncbi:MAG: M16 family metallopeptidase [Myxococcaceae bacterium]